MKYLPSVKVLISLGVLVLGTSFSLYLYQKSSTTASNQANSLEVVTIEDLNNKDGDGDGVKDWEEALWGTDPHKSDSNGTGVSDSEFIAKKRESITGSVVAQRKATGTITDTFSQQLFTSITSLSQSGGYSKDTVDSLAQSTASNLTTPKDVTRYTTNDIKTVVDSPQATVNYKSALKKTGTGLDISSLGNEVNLLAQSINKPKNSELEQKLILISTTYALLGERTARVTVPISILDSHLELVNAYYGLSVAITGLSLLYNDPVQSVQALALYKSETSKLFEATEKISAYLAQ